MDHKQIFKSYIREEFIKKLEDEQYGYASNSGLLCPSSAGLRDLNNCEFAKTDCKGCWLRAIKKVRFLGE